MHLINVLSLIAGALGILGFIPYIRAVIRKETQPQKASWIAWGILNFITLAGMYVKGVATVQMTAITLGSWAVAALAFRYGRPGWSKLDKTCLGGAVLAIALWKLFDNSTFGIAISLLGLFVSGIPTWKSAWQTPKKENRAAWVIFAMSSLFALLTIRTFTVASVAQPIEFLVNQTVTVAFLSTRAPMRKLKTMLIVGGIALAIETLVLAR